MRKTVFAGLSVLGPEDSIYSDGAAFTTRDRDEIDRGMKIGIKTHRHTGKAGLSNPTLAPSASIIASGGTIDAGLSIMVGYTLEDGEGGETMISPLSVASTPVPIDVPLNAPEAEADYTAGNLLIDNYTYGITYIDAEGGETPLGPTVLVNRDPGFENARIKLKGLTKGLEAAGAVGWRLFRARGGGEFAFLASGTKSEDTFTDDGSVSPVCDTHPPTDNVNTTGKINTLQVAIPSGLASGASFINLYATINGDFGESSLLAQYPIASAGASPTFSALEFLDSQPPDVNRSYGGANMIDPDSEILDWHWRKPVAGSGLLGSGSLGDVKLVEGTGDLYAVLLPRASAAGPVEWTKLGSGGKIAASGEAGKVSGLDDLTFVGSGGTKVTVASGGGTKGIVTITGPQLTASAASGAPGSVVPVTKLTLVGSGNVQVGLANPTPGEAKVTIMASGAGGGSPLAIFGSGSAVAGAETANVEKIEVIGSGGVNVKESSSGKTAKLVLEGEAAARMDKGMGVMVLPVSQKAAARPQYKCVTWFCKEKPTNMAEFDIWIEEGP
jgi:hypothetical protein